MQIITILCWTHNITAFIYSVWLTMCITCAENLSLPATWHTGDMICLEITKNEQTPSTIEHLILNVTLRLQVSVPWQVNVIPEGGNEGNMLQLLTQAVFLSRKWFLLTASAAFKLPIMQLTSTYRSFLHLIILIAIVSFYLLFFGKLLQNFQISLNDIHNISLLIDLQYII